MKSSKTIQVDVDCEKMGLKNYPIPGYPITCYKQNYEKPIHHHTERRLRSPSTPIYVEPCSTPVGVCSVPRYRLNYIDKYMDVPVVQKVAKVVEIPEVREITKYVDVVKVVDVPVEQVRMVPKLQVREVEKIRHVPGPIEYIDVPQEVIVHKPRKEIVEKIHEIPVIEDIEVEVPFYVPTPVGPPEEIRIEVPLPYDVPQFCYKPEKKFLSHMPVAVRHVTNEGIHQFAINESNGRDYDELYRPATITPQKNLPFLYSSPVFQGYARNENNQYENKINEREEEEEKCLDEILYSYNKPHLSPTPSIKTVPRKSSNFRRKYSTNDISCYKTCCSASTSKKTNKDIKIILNNENSNKMRNDMVYTYENSRTTTPRNNYVKLPASNNQYYYTYSAQNEQYPNSTNYNINEETNFVEDQQMYNGIYYNQEENYVANDCRNVNEESYAQQEDIYTAQKQIDNNFNMEYEQEETYYGDESNYVYGNEYMMAKPKKSTKKSVAELIVKKKRGTRFD